MRIKKIVKKVVVFLGVCVPAVIVGQDVSQDIQVKAVHNAKVRLAVCVASDAQQELKEVAHIIKNDCMFSGQFEVSTVAVPAINDVNEERMLSVLCERGYILALYLVYKSDLEIEWRLYDTASKTMIEKRVYSKRGASRRWWGHHLADLIWPVLTGQDGFFSSRIAYCKEVKLPGKKKVQHICVADYDGANEQTIVDTPTVNLAPRFNRDPHNQLLFYSESTNRNIRLMHIDMKSRKRGVASNFDGVNMLPSFCADGTKVAYCASKGAGNCDIYYYQKGSVKQLTHDGSNNISPVFNDDGTQIFYCSDRNGGVPQLYCYTLSSGSSVALTKGPGAAYCPAYCAKRRQLAYCKKAKKIMQIFVYDETLKTHTQLTFNAGDKDECAWSPCGNYLLYGTERQDQSRIACFNLLTRQERFITPPGVQCSYPTYSFLVD